MQQVFSTRAYFDNVVKKEMATFQVCYNNFISKVYNDFGAIHPARFTWVKINDPRCHQDAFMFICNDDTMVDVPASHHIVNTTMRAAIYAEYMSFVQAFLMQLFSLSSEAQLKKFGFASQKEKDNEVQRLSDIYEDLKLAAASNITNAFSAEERSAILQLID